MSLGFARKAGARKSWIRIQLFAFLMLLGTAFGAYAEDCVADFGGVIDGNVVNPAPSQPEHRWQLHHQELPAAEPTQHQHQLLHVARPDGRPMAGGVRQRRFHPGQHRVRRRARAQDLVRQRLPAQPQAELPELPGPGRVDQQAGACLCRRGGPVHLQAADSRPDRPVYRHRGAQRRFTRTICTGSRSTTTSAPIRSPCTSTDWTTTTRARLRCSFPS